MNDDLTIKEIFVDCIRVCAEHWEWYKWARWDRESSTWEMHDGDHVGFSCLSIQTLKRYVKPIVYQSWIVVWQYRDGSGPIRGVIADSQLEANNYASKFPHRKVMKIVHIKQELLNE